MRNITLHPSMVLLVFLGLFGGFFRELIVFFCIIIFHELGHILTALFFNIKCHKLYLTMFGGLIELDDYNEKNVLIKLLINTSGIIVNLILIMIFKIIKTNFIDNNIFINYNYLMIFVNLLPITPLDGYKILFNLLTIIFDDEYAEDCLFYFSLIILSILSIILFILKLYGYYLILFFLYYKTIANKRSNKHYKLKQYSFLKRI